MTVEFGRSRAMRKAVEPEKVQAATALRLERVGDLVRAGRDGVGAGRFRLGALGVMIDQ